MVSLVQQKRSQAIQWTMQSSKDSLVSKHRLVSALILIAFAEYQPQSFVLAIRIFTFPASNIYQ